MFDNFKTASPYRLHGTLWSWWRHPSRDMKIHITMQAASCTTAKCLFRVHVGLHNGANNSRQWTSALTEAQYRNMHFR